jgi:hypothetical protein
VLASRAVRHVIDEVDITILGHGDLHICDREILSLGARNLRSCLSVLAHFPLNDFALGIIRKLYTLGKPNHVPVILYV